MENFNKNELLREILIAIFTAIITCVLTHYFTIKAIDYEHSLEIVENNLSEEELLINAQKYYKIGEYIKAVNIYEMDKLEINPIALNNLGYMYEEGILFEKNLFKAKSYYEKAAQLGNYQAMENWINFTICYPESYDELLNCLKYGYENESQVVYEFLSEYMPSADNTDERVARFFELPSTSMEKVLKLGIGIKKIDKETKEYVGSDFLEKTAIDIMYHPVKKILGNQETKLIDLGDGIGTYVERIKIEGEVKEAFTDIIYYQKIFLYSENYSSNFIEVG